jgi:hypothetical protein
MDKVPRKKEKKRIGRKTILLILLCCMAAAGAGAYFLNRPAPVPPLVGGEEKTLLLSRPAEEIASVAFSPAEGTAYSLIRQGDSFGLMGYEDTPLKALALDEFFMSVEELPAETVVLQDLDRNDELSMAVFGFSPVQGRMAITYADGEKKELLLGNLTPDTEKPQRYCMLENDPTLYTILASDAIPFLREMDYWLDFTQPKLDSSLLDRIDISGNVSWSAFYTPTGWQMEAPFSYPLAPLRMDALLEKISATGFESFLGDAEKVDLARYGLEAPALTVRLTQAATVITGQTAEGEDVTLPVPETVYTLQLGDETGKSGVYALWENKVYKASNFLLGFWKSLNPMDYLLQTPVNFYVNNLCALTFSMDGRIRRYEVRMVESITENNQIAADEYGRILYDCAVRRAGENQDMDAEAFLSWYTRLASLSGDGRLPDDFVLSGESRCTILLENDNWTRQIDFYPYDALHDALAVDGMALYYVQKTWLDGVMDAP